MNKYINTFASSGDYETYKVSSALSTPNVAYIEDSKEVKYLNSKKDLYNIYGTLTGDSATATIQINGTSYSVTPSGADNEFGLVFSQPVTGLRFTSPSGIKTLDKIDVDTSALTSMADMFKNGGMLTMIDVSNWNTSAVTNMSGMFWDCSSLTTLDVNHWDISSVTAVNEMFRNCNSITNFDLSNWNTSKVTNMRGMFYDCASITSLDLSNFNTNIVTNMRTMFMGCNSITNFDLSNWNTSAVTDTYWMFKGCRALTTVIMNSTSTTTFDKIKTQLVTDSVASHVTIIRDGVNWKYQNGAWVEA